MSTEINYSMFFRSIIHYCTRDFLSILYGNGSMHINK
jgi:hypothetical protein